MSITERTWVSDAQYRSIQAGLRVVCAWAAAEREPEAALDGALRSEREPADVVVGLATVALRVLKDDGVLSVGLACGRLASPQYENRLVRLGGVSLEDLVTNRAVEDPLQPRRRELLAHAG